MNKWLVIAVACIVVPFIVIWMWIRHPKLCWRGAKESWDMVFRGKGNYDDNDNDTR